jgi:hypothetical protein
MGASSSHRHGGQTAVLGAQEDVAAIVPASVATRFPQIPSVRKRPASGSHGQHFANS